jgi:hypothetical protein
MKSTTARLAALERRSTGYTFRILHHDGHRFTLKSAFFRGVNRPADNQSEVMTALCANLNAPSPNRSIDDFMEDDR